MKKSILLMLLLLTSAAAVMAQDPTLRKSKDRGRGLYLGADRDTVQYVVASPFDNWYLEGGLGLQTYIGNEYEDTARWNPIDYNFYVEIGKWVIPDVAVALNFSHFGVHSQTRYGNNPWVDFSDSPTMSLEDPVPSVYFPYKPFSIQGASLTGLVYMEWTNLFNGYEVGESKRFHVMTPLGLGMTMLYGGQVNPRAFDKYPEGSFRRNFELHALAGMSFEYRITKAITLHANANLKIARGSLDASPTVSESFQQSGVYDFMPSLQVGARINMIKRVTKVDPRTGRTYTAVVHHQFLPAHTERISYLENRIDTLMVQMSTISTTEDRDAAANLAAVRQLNHQLDSLKNLLQGDKQANANLLEQIVSAQKEIDRMITIISEGRKPFDLSAAKALVERQLSRQDSIDLLMGRLARLQSDLAKGQGTPSKIKEEMGRALLMRDRLLDDADADNYEYGIEDDQGLYTPLDASQTAYRRVLYSDLLNRLYDQLAILQKKLDSKEVDVNAVNKQLEAVRAELSSVASGLGESGTGLTNAQMAQILDRQRGRRDTLSRINDRIVTLYIKIADSIDDDAQHFVDLLSLGQQYESLLQQSEQDNHLHHIDDQNGTLSPLVAARAASDQAAIRQGMDKVAGMISRVQASINSNNADPQVIMANIAAAQHVLDSIVNSVDVGGGQLTGAEAKDLMARQQARMSSVADIEHQLVELQKKLKSGSGNAEVIRSEIRRLAALRQDILDQAEDDNLNYGVTDAFGDLNPFETAQLAVVHAGYRELVGGLDNQLASLQGKIDRPESSKEEVRIQINATKDEIDHINNEIGENTSGLTLEQLKALVEEQTARQDSISYLDRRINSLTKRLERGSGDSKQLSSEIAKLKEQRDALRSKSRKVNAENKIDNSDNTLSPLVAVQNAYDQTNLNSRLGYIRSMLDALLRNMGGAKVEQDVMDQIVSLQARIDSAVVVGRLQGMEMNPAEADALVARQQARLDSINDIDRKLRQLNRQLDRNQGDPKGLEQEIARLTELRNALAAAAVEDNRTHGVVSADKSPLVAAREAVKQSRRYYEVSTLNAQLDSLRALLAQERFDADPMAQINEAILQLDLPMARVYYQLGRYELDYNARKSLHEFALRLKRSGSDLKYYIIGAADAQTGSPAFNKELSSNRCKAVYDVLVRSYGVPEEQLEMHPLGGITEFEQQENNRTAIIVLSNHEVTKIIEKWRLINEADEQQK